MSDVCLDAKRRVEVQSMSLSRLKTGCGVDILLHMEQVTRRRVIWSQMLARHDFVSLIKRIFYPLISMESKRREIE